LFLKIGTKMLRFHSSGILFDQKIRLNNLVSQIIATSPRLLHTLIGIPFRPIVLPPVILFNASLTSDSWILCTDCLLKSYEEMSNSMDELPLSSMDELPLSHRQISLDFMTSYPWRLCNVTLENEWNKVFLDGLTIGKRGVSPDELYAVINKRIERFLIHIIRSTNFKISRFILSSFMFSIW
jgi:hypothetical protein